MFSALVFMQQKRLHSEMMQYMTYLKEEAEREKQREKELDRMLQVEVRAHHVHSHKPLSGANTVELIGSATLQKFWSQWKALL